VTDVLDDRSETAVDTTQTSGEFASSPARTSRTPWLSVGTALTILGAVLTGCLLDAVAVGDLRHARDRQVAYAHFRYDLAYGTAPTGALDVNGKPAVPGTPVALLEIPNLGIREVVGYGATSSELMAGPGLRRDTVLPGQTGRSVILGRRLLYGGPFQYIGQLQYGDPIIVTTGQAVSHFKVVDVRRPGAAIPPEFLNAPASLVLSTASGNAWAPSDVLRVDAVLDNDKNALPDGPVGAAYPDDQALASEGSAWVPLVFWGQALVLAAVAATWLRVRWGTRQSWLIGVPVLAALGFAVADTAFRLLPNVM
jgi:hypothetical protein